MDHHLSRRHSGVVKVPVSLDSNQEGFDPRPMTFICFLVSLPREPKWIRVSASPLEHKEIYVCCRLSGWLAD